MQWDGILGLSPDDDSAGPLLVDRLYKSGQIDYPVFSIVPGTRPNEHAEITFGSFDETQPITSHRIAGSFHWELPFQQIEVGDGLAKIKPSVRNVIVDTGTSMILGYYEEIEEIMQTICKYIGHNLKAQCSNQTNP